MSRIGNKAISIPAGVKVDLRAPQVMITGPKGNLSWSYPGGVNVVHDTAKNQIRVERTNDLKQSRANHGLTRALLNNMVRGVTEGYRKELHVYGTGFNVNVQGQRLLLNIGYMGRGHGKPAQFDLPIPAGVTVKVLVPAARGESDPAKFEISGIDKQAVGQFAAEVRKLRKPEPYLGKGIRYSDEVVKKKAGKAFAGGGGG